MILSDDDLMELDGFNYDEPQFIAERDFARAIEAKVLEKLSDKLRDAERYEWLRGQHWSDDTLTVTKPEYVKLGRQTYCGIPLDAAIDAAIKESK